MVKSITISKLRLLIDDLFTNLFTWKGILYEVICLLSLVIAVSYSMAYKAFMLCSKGSLKWSLVEITMIRERLTLMWWPKLFIYSLWFNMCYTCFWSSPPKHCQPYLNIPTWVFICGMQCCQLIQHDKVICGCQLDSRLVADERGPWHLPWGMT